MSSKLLFFAGSARKDSLNKKLAKAAYEIAIEAGADATFVDLADYPMPIYNGDLEDAEGLPENARKFKALLCEHQGFFIASPEYNSSFSPLLKNALDWASRSGGEDEPVLVAYKGKTVALAAASPGGFGGLRGLVPLRMMLGNIGVHVLPDQLAIPKASGDLDERTTKTLTRLVRELIKVTGKLND